MHRQHDQAFISPISLGNVVCKCTIMKLQNESARLLLSAFPPSCPFELVLHKQTNPSGGEGAALPVGMLSPREQQKGPPAWGCRQWGPQELCGWLL